MSMNIFRLTGDGCHSISIVIFLHVVCWKKNASCVSLKSQILYMMVFATRYLDLFTSFYSYYNSGLKLFYLSTTAGIIYTIKYVEPTKSTYSSSQDEFPVLKYSIGLSALLALIIADDPLYMGGMELLWSYSIIQEATAMIPQLLIAYNNRHIQSEIKLAILFMGVYRFFYILNWIYRAHTEENYRHHWLVYICGVLQVAIYSDFFYHAASTIYANCRTSGNESANIAWDGHELSEPLITVRETEGSVVVPSEEINATTTISNDEQCNTDCDANQEANSNVTPSVQVV